MNPYTTTEFRSTVHVAPEKRRLPFDLEQEDPIGFYRGLYHALPVVIIFWGLFIYALVEFCKNI